MRHVLYSFIYIMENQYETTSPIQSKGYAAMYLRRFKGSSIYHRTTCQPSLHRAIFWGFSRGYGPHDAAPRFFPQDRVAKTCKVIMTAVHQDFDR